MSTSTRSHLSLVTLAVMTFVAACAGGNQFTELRNEQPSPYYLHIPEAYAATIRWPLLIALPTVREDGRDCMEEWFEIADQNQIFLLCPELVSDGEQLDRSENERILANILNQLYQDYALRDRFFLVGRGAAASFALGYAVRYPHAIEGVSSIAAADYPDGGTMSGSFPILVIVEDQDQPAIEAGQVFIASLDSGDTQARLLEIENLRNSIPYSVQRLTVELFEQTAR